MMRRIWIYLIFLALQSTFCAAQLHTYIGTEVGPKFCVYRATPHSNSIKPWIKLLTPQYSLYIGQELHEHFRAEIGITSMAYDRGYQIKDEGFLSMSETFKVLQIPIRIKGKLDLAKDRLSFFGTLGYSLNIIRTEKRELYDYYQEYTELNQIPEWFTVDEWTRFDFRNVYSLIEGGIGLEFKFKRGLCMYLSGSYYLGLQKVIEVDVEYFINNDPPKSGTVYSNGDYFNVLLGFRYPISRIWIKD